jgi:hypothetical protein
VPKKQFKTKTMKKLLLLFIFSFGVNAQKKVNFNYDLAGNQTSRVLCINCIEYDENGNPTSKIAQNQDYQKLNPEDSFSYYPNPVQEQLYLKWEKANQATLTSIQIFSLSGQVMKTLVNLENKNKTSLAFQAYPQGVYSVLLIYSDGEEKSIKIIKQ